MQTWERRRAAATGYASLATLVWCGAASFIEPRMFGVRLRYNFGEQ